MRLRLALVGSLLAAFVAFAAPGIASAAPHRNSGLTINATPNPILAGEGVLIYGQITGGTVAGQTIRLYHRINPAGHFSLIRTTTTDRFGFYEFTRAEGIVYTNRSWFVRGPDGMHSRTLHEQVSALVSLQANRAVAYTRQSVVFSGHVTPNHAFDRVYLQVQNGDSDDWLTVASGVLGRGSNYRIAYGWRFPGQRIVRVLLPGDDRNLKSASDPVAITVQQPQVSSFTINSSSPVITIGQQATISGTLYMKGSTSTPEPNTPVTLCGRTAEQPQFICDTAGVTGSNGSYSFTVSPVYNEMYMVEATLPPHRQTAVLLEGVRDAVSLGVQSSATAGQPVTFTGSAIPNKAGDTVYLQRLGADGDWHTVSVSTVRYNSTFQFVHVFGTAGTKTFRARVLGDPLNVGGVSAPVQVTLTLPPVTSLPPTP